jgi:hypothetical protein
MRLFNGLRKVVGAPAEYHIVKRSHNSEFESYDIYFDNRPCLVATKDFSLDRATAKRIANLLNGKELVKNVTPRPAHTARSTSGS